MVRIHVERHGSVSKPIVPLVNIKIAGKWMIIPLKMVLIGIDPYPHQDFAAKEAFRKLFRDWTCCNRLNMTQQIAPLCTALPSRQVPLILGQC
jgi:hypothetical protein